MTVTLNTPVVGGHTVGNAVYLRPSTHPLQDPAGNAAAAYSIPATNITGDTIAPNLVGTPTVNGTALSLSFNEAMDPYSLPDAGDFTVTVNGDEASLADTNPVAIDGAAVTLTLATAVPSNGQTVTVSYTPGTAPLQDLAGNDAASLTARTVLNAADMTPPRRASTTVNGQTVTVTFDEDLDTSVMIDPGRFLHRVGSGTLQPATAISMTRRTVTLTVKTAARHGQEVALRYTVVAATSKNLKDSSGNKVPPPRINALWEVTNNTPPA